MSERLELVKRFEELRAGMIVVCVECGWCGGKHRGMLVKFVRNVRGSVPRSGSSVDDGWVIEPPGKCNRTAQKDLLVREAVTARCVFRVVDDLEASDSSSVPRKLERTR
jgi:hypothetical protein